MRKIKVAIIGDRSTFRRNENYYNAVTACGAQTIALPLCGDLSELKDADALLVPGGCDIDPVRYHEANTRCMGIDDALDDFELSAIKEAVSRKLPILGICRGHQLINVFFGGTLTQDVANRDRHVWIDANTDNSHMIKTAEGSFLRTAYGKEQFFVNSAHHQCVKELGDGLISAAESEDGINEALFHCELPFFGVQWHPERTCLRYEKEGIENGLALFRWFLGLCG